MVCSRCEGKHNLSQKGYGKKVGELRHNINKAFDNFFNILDYPLTPLSDFSFIEPKIEMVETENDIKVSAELPGMESDDVEVDVSEDGYLRIRGEKKNSVEDNSNGRYFSERSYGMISRTIPLSADVDIDKVEAKFSNGVIKINLPKTLASKQRIKKIQVKK